jgi:hypothetical protein
MCSPSRVVIVDPIADRVAVLSLVHVTELRTVEPQTSPQ